MNKRTDGRSLILMTLVLLVAAFLRLYRLAEVPPGLGMDESWIAVEALNFGLYGAIPTPLIKVPELTDRMVRGLFLGLVGPYLFTVRFVTVLWGMLSIALTYQAGRALLQGRPYRDTAGLVAAATLTVMLSHMLMSRAVYRMMTLVTALATAIWLLGIAWHSGRRRDFALAGLAWGCGVITHTPGLMMPPTLVAIIVHQAIFDFRKVRKRFPQIGIMFAMVLLVGLIPFVEEIAIPGPLYIRLTETRADNTVDGLWEMLKSTPSAMWASARAFYLHGDPNPKANVAAQPLLNPVLFGLFLVGILACLATFCRLPSAILLGSLLAMMIPAALSDLPINGTRIVGVLVVTALLIGRGSVEILVLLEERIGRVARQVGIATLLAILIGSGASAFRIFFDFYDDPLRWDANNSQGFWWYFLTGHTELAEQLNMVSLPTYIPLEEYNFPATHFVLAGRYPHTRSFSELTTADGSLSLPDGQVVIPIWISSSPPPTTYVLLIPHARGYGRGEVVLLPALAPDQAAKLLDAVTHQGTAWQTKRHVMIARQVSVVGIGNPFGALEMPSLNRLASFGDHLHLVGWDAPRELIPGSEAVVTLYWQASKKLGWNYYAYAHLLDRFGNGLTSGGDEQINRWGYSPRTWQPGQVIPDSRIIQVPIDLPPGPYGILLGVYPPYQDALPVSGPDGTVLGNSFQLWTLKVTAPRQSIPADLITVNVNIGDRVGLLGYTVIRDNQRVGFSELRPGDTFTLTLYWQALKTITESYHIFVHIENTDGVLITTQDGLPQDGAYPTSIWDQDEVVMTTHTLSLPVSENRFSVRVGMYTWPDLVRLTVIQDGSQVPDSRAILWATK